MPAANFDPIAVPRSRGLAWPGEIGRKRKGGFAANKPEKQTFLGRNFGRLLPTRGG